MLIILFVLLLYIPLLIHQAKSPEEYRGRLNIAFLIPLAIAAGSAIYQGIKGAKQKREARRLQDEANSQEANNTAFARRMAMTGLPEAQYQQALRQIYSNQSLSLAALRDRRSALAGLPSVQQATNDALLNLNAQDANARRDAEIRYLGQSNRAAGLKAGQAQQTRLSGEALTGAALQNLYGAALSASSGFETNGNGTDNYFGNTPDGYINRAILGTTPIDNTPGISTALTNKPPTSVYAKPY